MRSRLVSGVPEFDSRFRLQKENEVEDALTILVVSGALVALGYIFYLFLTKTGQTPS